MKLQPFDVDLEKAVKQIKDKKYKMVLLQIPEGLKNNYISFLDFLENKTDASFLISADPCFGACDIVGSEIKNLGIDFVIQIGHTPFPYLKNYQIPTIFINVKTEIEIKDLIIKAIPFFVGKKIGVVSTAQHVHLLDKAKKILIEHNLQPIIEKGDSRIEKKGQIIGCNFSSAKKVSKNIDMFLFIGDGIFHPLGLRLATKKPVITCNPYTKEVKKDEIEDIKDMILRQRYGAIARSKEAKIFGILIGTKIGQQRADLAFKLKEKLDSHNKKSFIFISNNFNPSNLEGFRNIDCFISTACPRIAIDDYMLFNTPILTPIELDILLGIKRWGDYRFDEILNA